MITVYGCWTKNRGDGKTPQIIYLLIGFSIIFTTIHFGVPLFLETSISVNYESNEYILRF